MERKEPRGDGMDMGRERTTRQKDKNKDRQMDDRREIRDTRKNRRNRNRED